MKKAAVVGISILMALSLGACGSGSSSETETTGTVVAGESTAAEREAAGAEADEDKAESDPGASDAAESETADAGKEDAAVESVSGTEAADINGTSIDGAGRAGSAADEAATEADLPLMLDAPSMKTAYRPETEEEKYARELTGLYLLTDLKDTRDAENEDRAAQLEAEGRPMYLEFFANGTLRETVFGDPIGGTWDMEYLTIGAERIPYTWNKDRLTITSDNMNLTFTRTSEEELALLLSTGADGQDAADEAVDESGEDAAGERTADEADTEETADADNTEETADGTEADDGMDETDAADYDGTDEDAFEETLLETELCSLVATGYDFSDPRGFVIKVRCENDSIYHLDFSITDAVVNNVMFEPGTPEEDHWNMEVEPMSSREGEIVFRADRAAEYGITSYDYVLLGLWVRNEDDWSDNTLYQGDKELYPTNKVTGAGIQNLKRRAATGEQKIAEESKFTFTILDSQRTENGDFVLKACIENLSYQNLTFIWDDVYVNGGLLDPFFACEVLPGTICYEDIVFPASDLQAGGVSDVAKVTFTMTVYDSKDWLAYSIYTKESTYKA